MTHEGIKKMMRVICASYPNFHPNDMEDTIVVWENLLKPYEDKTGAAALRAYILSDRSGFPPTIGQLVGLMDKPSMSEFEAWSLVARAIRNGNYGAEEEFSKLPDTIKEAVGSPGQLRAWASMDSKAVESVGQSNFLRSYKVAIERARTAEKLPIEMARIYRKDWDEPVAIIEEKRPEGVPMPEGLMERLMR